MLMSTTPTKPVPAITDETRPFYEGAKLRELRVQRCRDCGALRFPARTLCSECLSTQSDWVKVSGDGEVFTFNVMHQVYHPGFATEVPYAVVVVRLAEGPKMISNLVGVAPRDVHIGMKVHAVFEDLTDEVTLPKFAPA
jgi:uncharacterized OB-fold protein